jgi:hypothetical protein
MSLVGCGQDPHATCMINVIVRGAKSINRGQAITTRHRDLVTQFSDQRLHLRGNAYGCSSPCTHHSTVDDKPYAVYKRIRSTDATPVQRPCHGRRTIPEK